MQIKTAPGRDEPDENGEVLSFKLKKYLHDLSVCTNLWYGIFKTSLLEVVFIVTKPNPCVYTYGSSDTLVIIILYMDDILLN